MPEQNIFESSDVWNVAQGYTQLKILKPLVEMDKLVRIAIYGTEHIEESLQLPPNLKILNRIEAINRLIDILKEVIENTYFALGKNNKPILDELEKRLREVESFIDGISTINSDMRDGSNKVVLNEDHFNLCLKKLRAIKRELPDPLNKNGLIFPTSEEIDLDKFKNDLIFGG